MGQFHLWLRRKDLAGDIGWLFDEGRTRKWQFQPFPWWRRLLLRLQGWDAVEHGELRWAAGSAGTRRSTW